MPVPDPVHSDAAQGQHLWNVVKGDRGEVTQVLRARGPRNPCLGCKRQEAGAGRRSVVSGSLSCVAARAEPTGRHGGFLNSGLPLFCPPSSCQILGRSIGLVQRECDKGALRERLLILHQLWVPSSAERRHRVALLCLLRDHDTVR